VPEHDGRDPVEEALRAEQHLVRSLGGFVLGIAGADLVTHERIPLPRFNFVQVHAVAPGRQTAFFERALDHYFQRALRPSFRVPTPVPSHVDTGLRALGFSPRSGELALLLGGGPTELSAPPGVTVRPAHAEEVDEVLGLWTAERERPELRTAIDIVWHHPNPGERLAPVVAVRSNRVLSAGIRYETRGTAGLHFIATRPGERGQGAASALVAGSLGPGEAGGAAMGFLFADSPRLEARLIRLGFRRARAFAVYELSRDAQLVLPSAVPAGPPRWRPPRAG
jgi:hypothetical protein